jgi:ABC-2 type transport system ATP-binding protein
MGQARHHHQDAHGHPVSVGGSAHVLGLVPWRERENRRRIATVFDSARNCGTTCRRRQPGIAGTYLERIRQRTKRLHDLVERFEIQSLLDIPVRKLSLGERMRCEIVGSLLHRPAILFLDEPTIGLDVVAKQRIRQHIRELNDTEGTTVFLTSHDAGDVEQLCRRVIMINHGTVVFDDSVTALKQQFLARKRIELKLLAPAAVDFADAPGVDVIRHDDFELVVASNFYSFRPPDVSVGIDREFLARGIYVARAHHRLKSNGCVLCPFLPWLFSNCHCCAIVEPNEKC